MFRCIMEPPIHKKLCIGCITIYVNTYICIEYLNDGRTNFLRPAAVLVYGQAHVTMYFTTREMLGEESYHVMIFIFFLWANWLNY